MHPRHGQSGVALPMVLVAVAVLGATVAGLLGLLAVRTKAATAARASEVAFYAAEAGVHTLATLTYYEGGVGWCSDPAYDQYQGVIFREPGLAVRFLAAFRLTWMPEGSDACHVWAEGWMLGADTRPVPPPNTAPRHVLEVRLRCDPCQPEQAAVIIEYLN